jgi:serine/threonine-protein kinase
MGEVYRADDLKLGQAVALKFLPAIVEKDAARLQRFLNEVKIARQISHPNVCRVYDVGEVDGHHYLSMEYVDGEDLASLLRRIGRLPKDKAIQISRQLCAGLAAAHEQGILHRDLKPANVMIDGRGRARITDFGLATLAGAMRADEVGAGTPLYMSPEQRAGKELTVRSDLYSLGLVLYELFTGQAAFKASTPAETARLQEASTPMSPTRLVEGLDPTIERAIVRCLEKEPRDRPASALAVSASLPGGDPLAAALAAGETPSPEMVAAAGEKGGLAANGAWACLVGIVLGLAAVLALAEFTRLESLVHLKMSRQVLEQQARDIAEKLGYRDAPRGRAVGFSTNGEYLKQLRNLNHARYDEALRTAKTPGILFWYRQSPDYLVPWGFWLERASPSDPPRTAPGSVDMLLDPDGRLIALSAVPAGYDDATRSTTSWTELLGAAHLDPGALSPATPAWTPPAYADSRAAWDGTIDGYKVHVEAAAVGEHEA